MSRPEAGELPALRVERRAEDALDSDTRAALLTLLSRSFPGCFKDRVHYKQLPHWRLLAWRGAQLLGQVGVDHRMVRAGGEPRRIFGVVDLCVAEDARSQGLGARLLSELIDRGRRAGVEHLLLFADDPRLYEGVGFRRAAAEVRFLALDDHRSCGLRRADRGDCMMTLDLGSAPWPAGEVDLLGYLF